MTQEQIELTVEFTIEDGKLEEFEKLVQELVNAVRDSEQGTMRYQWYLSDKDKTKCVVSELYKDSDAALAHINGKGVESILVPKIFPIAKMTRFEVYGNPSKELQEELAKLDSNNYNHLTGFTR
jgi:quinol monooxygenase YgiN